ncbi:MAG: PHP domain-containing protein [Candidatus Woesearchaeota archaeon]|nr:PHP domain-containing protein [Candidatus Woesearchaeota archaeon]
MLKADLHLHTNKDPIDRCYIKYSPKELIDYASKLGFDVLAITHHRQLYYNKEIADYAAKKGILLMPGAEILIEGKEVLLYNFKDSEIRKIKTFEDLKRSKRKNNLVIAPHPFLPHHHFISLFSKLVKNRKCFDGIEFCHFYAKFFNSNKRAVRFAHKFKLPLVGNSDLHRLWQMNYTYSMIDSKKDINSVIAAIKKGKIIVKSRPLPVLVFLRVIWFVIRTAF